MKNKKVGIKNNSYAHHFQNGSKSGNHKFNHNYFHLEYKQYNEKLVVV